MDGMEVTLERSLPPAVRCPEAPRSPAARNAVLAPFRLGERSAVGAAKIEVLLDDTGSSRTHACRPVLRSELHGLPPSDDERWRSIRAGTRWPVRLALCQDAAGNERVVGGERGIEVANEAPAASKTLLSTSRRDFQSTSRRTLTVPYGRRVSLLAVSTLGSERRRRASRSRASSGPTGAGPREGDEDGDDEGRRLVQDRPRDVSSLAGGPARVPPGRRRAVVSRDLRLRVIGASRVRASLRGRVGRFSGTVSSGPTERAASGCRWRAGRQGRCGRRFRGPRTDRRVDLRHVPPRVRRRGSCSSPRGGASEAATAIPDLVAARSFAGALMTLLPCACPSRRRAPAGCRTGRARRRGRPNRCPPAAAG